MKWTSLTRRLPPAMERSLGDDLRAACGVLLGAALAWLVFGAHDVGLIVGALAGCLIFMAGINVARRARSRREK